MSVTLAATPISSSHETLSVSPKPPKPPSIMSSPARPSGGGQRQLSWRYVLTKQNQQTPLVRVLYGASFPCC